jgi:hypothetical protein
MTVPPEISRRWAVRFNPEITFGNVISAIIILGGIFGVYVKGSNEFVALDARVSVLERAMVERRTEEREAVTDIKKQLDDLTRTLYEWKVSIAEKGKAK